LRFKLNSIKRRRPICQSRTDGMPLAFIDRVIYEDMSYGHIVGIQIPSGQIFNHFCKTEEEARAIYRDALLWFARAGK